jgi:EcsC protein family
MRGPAGTLGSVTVTDHVAARELPPGLWDRLRLDPVRAPEHIALAASTTFAPMAERWAADKRSRFAVEPAELAKMAKKRHATMARFEGAATGVGGIVTMVPDLVALAWIQSRVVFYVAAAYGYDPHDPMRPAELLVLHDFYSDPLAARRALDGVGTTIVEAYVGSKLQREEALAMRLAKFLGVRSARKLAGRVIPGVAIAFNAIGNERRTRALADKAIRFYGG